jgi:hypothetical protein
VARKEIGFCRFYSVNLNKRPKTGKHGQSLETAKKLKERGHYWQIFFSNFFLKIWRFCSILLHYFEFLVKKKENIQKKFQFLLQPQCENLPKIIITRH